ncbi:hypothetical protein RB200_34835 [Streptomyces sp. PmtG]
MPLREIAGQRPPGALRHPRQLTWLLAVAYGLTIANLYYCQPLLPRMADSVGAGSAAGQLVTAGQLGYLLALVLVVPLGDIVRRRPLVCVSCSSVTPSRWRSPLWRPRWGCCSPRAR